MGKVERRLGCEQADHAEIVLREVVVERRHVRQHGSEHDSDDRQPASVQVRHLSARMIMFTPVRTVPLKLPVIFDSPIRSR